MNCPCKDCNDRWVSDHSNCHAHCDRYLKWTEETKERNRKYSETMRAVKEAGEFLHRKRRW